MLPVQFPKGTPVHHVHFLMNMPQCPLPPHTHTLEDFLYNLPK